MEPFPPISLISEDRGFTGLPLDPLGLCVPFLVSPFLFCLASKPMATLGPDSFSYHHILFLNLGDRLIFRNWHETETDREKDGGRTDRQT